MLSEIMQNIRNLAENIITIKYIKQPIIRYKIKYKMIYLYLK